jgi:hypothetical protein
MSPQSSDDWRSYCPSPVDFISESNTKFFDANQYTTGSKCSMNNDRHNCGVTVKNFIKLLENNKLPGKRK